MREFECAGCGVIGRTEVKKVVIMYKKGRIACSRCRKTKWVDISGVSDAVDTLNTTGREKAKKFKKKGQKDKKDKKKNKKSKRTSK